MKSFIFATAGLMLLMTGCTTKVYNQPGPTGQPSVIEHDRVIEQPQPAKPEVQNNIHVDRP